nr:hypothetical protein [Tanacetum cinerariifolium]
MHKAFPLPVIRVPTGRTTSHFQRITFNSHLTFTFNSQQETDQQYPTVAKIPVLDTRKFEQWQFRIQQYLQHEHYALWEVIEFGDLYSVPANSSNTTTTDTTSGESGTKSGRTVTLTAEDVQKKKNDVKARTTLLLCLPDEHQLQFSKYKTARELWAAILKTFGGNEATKKTKKNLLKQQYGNFKAEGPETLEQMFNRLQVIVGQLQFMDIEIKHDDLNQNGYQIKFEDINQIDEDDMEEMNIKWNMALLSMRADKFWKKTGKKISIQGSDVAGAPKNQDRGRRDNHKQGSKAEEHAPKALMAIDGVGWDWSYMANDEEDHALVADEVAPTEFALMANTSAKTLAQVESRLVEYKEREVKYCEKIKTLEFYNESNNKCIEILKKKLETLKEEKEGVDGKLAGLVKVLKDLDNLIESQRSPKTQFRNVFVVSQGFSFYHSLRLLRVEVIEFEDSYVVPASSSSTTTTDTTSDKSCKKSRRTVTLTAEDMQKKNDVKVRTTLLLSLPDEHQLRFSKGDLDTMILDDLYNHLKVYESEVQKKSEPNSQNMVFISSAKHSSGNVDGNTPCVSTASTNVPTTSASDINQIDEDDMEEMYIKWNMALLSMREDKFWKKTRKKIRIQGSDVAGFDKSKRSKAEEQTPKALMAIAGVGWDWSYMENAKEDHGLVANEVAPIEFALMANTSVEIKVFDNSLCSKDCKKNNDSLNSKITDLTDKLFDANNLIYHYKLALAQVESRLVEYKEREVKYCEKIRTLEFMNESNNECIEILKKKLETLKEEKEGVDGKLEGLLTASKDLDNLIEITDYSRPSPTVESTSGNDENKNPSVSETIASPITPKPFIMFVKPKDSQSKSKTCKTESPKKPPVKKLSTGSRNFPIVNRKFPTASRKFPTGSTKCSTADMGMKGKADSGYSRHMTGNISYLSDYEPFDGGYVYFGQGGCKITGKRTIKTDKLEFENVYFMKDLKDLTCLVAKASADKCILWHMRLGHLNFKTMNKLVMHNLVRGLPTKYFENDHTCTACLKGKQHKAFCKSKLVNSVSKPLHTLHMDLFGLTSISSISHKWYCLVVTDDFSRFTWTFFLKSKDETSGILKNFITETENLKDLKVKITRCDNGGEFRNKEMNDFCSQKGIKREFSNARTPQQNGVAERRNRTLIEAARIMLAGAKLPITLAEAVNTACYVQNRVLVNKSHNKTPYELVNGRSPAIGFLKPFGCHVMILNTLDNLGKFKEKEDEGYFIGYSMSNKAFRVFNKRTRRVEENLHVEFLKTRPLRKVLALIGYLILIFLTKSMNHVPVDPGTISTNLLGTKDAASQEVKKDVSSLRYTALPNWTHDALLEFSSSKPQHHYSTEVSKGSGNLNPTASTSNPLANQMETLTMETPIPTVSSPVSTAYSTDSQEPSSHARLISKRVANQVDTPSLDNILSLTNRFKDILGVTTHSDESNEVEADISNMETAITASPTPTLRIHKDHPKSRIIGPLDTPIKIRNKSKEVEAMQEELLQFKIQNVWTLDDCPKGVRPIGIKWVLKNKKDKKGIVIRNKDRLVAQGHTQEEGIDYDEVFAPVAKIKAIRLFLAYASFMAFIVYQMDVKSAFLYGTIDEPDIMFAVCARARHQVTPKECHLHAVKRIFRYLKGYPKLRLWYPKVSPFDLVAYLDSDYGGATQDRKSTTEGCQFLGRRLISWQCKKQTIIATSTTEAEYVAPASCCGQVLWIQNQLLNYGDCFEKKFINVDHIHTDENVADLLTKPFDARRFQDCFEKKFINVDHIHTDENVADLLTKPFDARRFQYLVVSIGMVNP